MTWFANDTAVLWAILGVVTAAKMSKRNFVGEVES